MNFAVFVSGYGSNLQAIINAMERGELKGHIGLVVSDRKDAYALKRAEKANLKTLFIDPKHYANPQSFDRQVVIHLKEEKIEYIVLAGFMRILSPYFIKTYRNRIINIHPSLLPSFRGAHAIEEALAYGAKVSGVTVHFVDEKIDHGPIIIQKALAIRPHETKESLESRIHQVEHVIYPKAIDLLIHDRLKVMGRKVTIV
jgi:phosphoribosylglycinamide formyltransferase-1